MATPVATPDPLLLQIITGQTLWSQLTGPQRRLLETRLSIVNAEAARRTDRYAVSAQPLDGAARTVESLRRKGVLDDTNRITWAGAYVLLWGRADGDDR